MKKNQKNGGSTLQSVLCILLAVVMFFVLHRLLVSGVKALTAFFIVLSVYLFLTVLFLLLGRLMRSKGKAEEPDEILSEDRPLAICNNLSTPIVLCNENGLITWGNRSFGELSDVSASKTRTLRSIMGFGLERLSEDEDNEGVLWENAGRSYRVYSKNSADGSALVWWEDITEAETLRRLREDEDPLLAYIVIDNIEELTQIERENTASLASAISHILLEWAAGAGGVIKEFERNKFIFLFTRASYNHFAEEKFSILDKIRWIPVGKSDFPATISIGISTISGTLSEKDAAAKAALELALARGGDQAVIKSESGIEFIGGMTKSSQKRSTVKSRAIADKLTNLIYDSSNVIIMGHKYADFDALGACVGIARLSMQCGKACYIIADRNNPDFIKCSNKLKSLHAYDNVFVSAAEAAELNYSDTLLVIVDVNNPTQFEDAEIAESVRKIAYIDHHRMTGEFARPPLLHYIEPSASSTCELISEILEQTTAGAKLSKQEADLMFAGIMLDTKRFVVNTGVRTFSAAQYLRGQGANPNEAQELFKTGLDDLVRQAKFETNVQIYRKVIAISVNTAEDNTAADRIAAAKVADNLLTVDGVLASFALCQIDDKARISARSTGKINVQKILEAIGGGGHYDSAATEMTCTIEEALSSLKNAIDCYLDD